MRLVKRSVLRSSLPFLLSVGTKCAMPPGNTTIVAISTFVQELLPRAPDEAWPTAIRLLSHTQARTSESTNLDAVTPTSRSGMPSLSWPLQGSILRSFGNRIARWPKQSGGTMLIFSSMMKPSKQEAALSDLAILGALPASV